jgi:quercetin dioxygenase-like cupin family protein
MRTRQGVAGIIVCAAALGCRPLPSAAPGGDATVRRVMFHALPSMEGSHLAVTVLEVSYRPGGSSPPHSHPCPVIGYVVEGALRVQVKSQSGATYRAGESFYEEPDGVHLVSANASDTEPVRFLAYFACDRDAPLSVAVPEPSNSGTEGTP